MEIEAESPNPPSVYIYGEYPIKYKVGTLETGPARHDVWKFIIINDLYFVNSDDRESMRDEEYEQDSAIALEAPFIPEEPFWSYFSFIIDKSYAKGELVPVRFCLKVTGTDEQLVAGMDEDDFRDLEDEGGPQIEFDRDVV